MTIDSRPRRLLTVLSPALLVPLQLLLFGPLSVMTRDLKWIQ